MSTLEKWSEIGQWPAVILHSASEVVKTSPIYIETGWLNVDLPHNPPFIPQVEEATYRNTIEYINAMFEDAEALGCRTYTEGCLACLTGYTIHYCFKTHYERVSQ